MKASLLERLGELAKLPTEVPEGHADAKEIAEAMGRAGSTVRNWLSIMYERGDLPRVLVKLPGKVPYHVYPLETVLALVAAEVEQG